MQDNNHRSSINKKDGDSRRVMADQEVAGDLKCLLEDSPIAVFTCNKAGDLTYFNEAAIKLWGVDPTPKQQPWDNSWKMYYTTGERMNLAGSPMARVINESRLINGEEITIETQEHVFKRVLVYARPLYDEQHNPIGTHSSLVDISDKILEESKQAILAAIVESSDDAIISKNLNGIIVSWNAGAERIFGYSEKEIVGKSITILIPSSRLQEEELILSRIRAGKKVDHFETIRVAKSGKQIPISITVSPVKDNYGNIVGASKIARDISEQIEAQRAIKQNSQNLELLNSIGKVILENLDVKSLLQQVTDATTKITGAAFGAFFYNTTDLNGEPFTLYTLSGAARSSFDGFNLPAKTNIFKQTFSDSKVIRLDDVTKDPDYWQFGPQFGMPKAHLKIVSYLAVPIVSTAGQVIGALIFGHPSVGVFKAEHEDIIGSIAAQAAIALENSKLFEEVKALSSKKDEFIALASHELKTPLTTIKGFLQIIAKKNQDTVGKLFVDKSLYQVEKLSALISDLLDVSKIEAGKLQFHTEAVDLVRLLKDVMETFPYTNKSHEIIFDDPNEQSVVLADKQRIEQVVINLLTNAIKYSPKANKVFVSLRNEGEFATVRVKDEGIGLKEEHLSKIFNRFYRADGVGNVSGLGIGLFLTKEIIDRHNGTILVNSDYGKGSEFLFSLPLQKSN
ncbi:MAG: multi-sensor signal transduction histidine kinase [Pedobacter sp.]|jgi:PAS domain S-box-containing protein|nr:multi-sensor signal transduction histidine kinase [Pedobacter sp.]